MDTSALIKLFVQEEHTDLVEHAVGEAGEVHTSEIAYLEARCAFARLREDGYFEDDGEMFEAVGYFEGDWPNYSARRLDGDLMRKAATLAQDHRGLRLRTYDALHVASAVELWIERTVPYPLSDPPDERPRVEFLGFDRRLLEVCRAEGIEFYFDPFPEDAEDPY